MEDSTAQLLALWGQGADAASDLDFASHVKAVAHGRFVLRRILRLLDEQAVAGGLQPLQHQALLQIYGADGPLPVNKVADRLDIAPALASRLIRQLEDKGLVERTRVPGDRRVLAVHASDAGIELLRKIDASVHVRVDHFQRQLSDEGKLGALATFAFYLGLDADPGLALLLTAAGHRH
ncbi:MarR family winged helix-turn-helix transcriptional regulator [Amycolatopsis alkalitolerans]|uniref:MarR family winged helix-turn-helix transcriptional regulator n=1 Tax=Amycolatopsis alkalitolerans TaxID=2547244 RepID=UPI00135AA038|nr:MarR family transcriptional regulator [Amycolatopsis alkalitolerans]